MNSLLRQINYQLNWAKARKRRPLRITLGELEWKQFEEMQKDIPTVPAKGPPRLYDLVLVKAKNVDSLVQVELEPMV